MDLAIILPMSGLLALQLLISLLLLGPRAISKHVASLLHLSRTSTAVSTVLHTLAVGIGAMTVSSILQLVGVVKVLNEPMVGAGDRAMALSVEELRALLSVVLGISNVALLFVNRALANEQQAADKAELNLEVLQKQAKGLTSEYMRATAQGQDSSLGVSAAAADNSTNESEVRELKQALEFARVEAKAAATNEAAVKAQAKGLESEYDRLLAENDNLKRKLARFDGQFAAGSKKGE